MLVGDEVLDGMKMSAAAVVVDCGIVGFVAIDEFDFGTKLFKNGFTNDASSTVGAIETEMEAAEVADIDVIAEMFEIEGKSFIMEVFAEAGGDGVVWLRIVERLLDACAGFGVEFDALVVAAFEDFDTVVGVRIVTSGHIDSEVETHLIETVINSRSGEDADV